MRLRSLLGLSLLFACGDDSSESPKVEVPAQLALVADWINGSVTYVDASKLASATTRAELATSTIDLSAYPPGPFDVALTPDHKTAFVSSSNGFFAIPGSGIVIGASNLPTGPGKLLALDVASGEVRATLDAGTGPMSVHVTPDGKRAIGCNFGSLANGDGTLVVIDVAQLKVTDNIPVGLIPEELALDDTGTVGAFGIGTAGGVRTFSVADPRNVLSDEVKLEGDSAGMAFFPGSKVAFVVQAPGITTVLAGGQAKGGYTVLDVTDPKKPTVLEDLRLDENPIGYPVVAAKNRGSVLVPVSIGSRLVLREYTLVNNKAALGAEIQLGEAGGVLSALGIAYDGDHTAVLALPGTHALVVVDLTAKTSRSIPWLPQTGPADVAF